MNNPKDSVWDDTEVMAQVEDFDFYEVDPSDVTHDPSYYGLELVLPVTDTRTLYLPCSWLGYIDYQCVTDSDTIWQISRTLGKYSGYGIKISDFVEITEDQPFLYDYNNSGHPVPCYEYTFKTNQESDQQSIKPSLETPVSFPFLDSDQSTDLCFDCALLNLDDQLQSLQDQLTRLMNKAADQGNVKVNSALYHICLGIDDFHQSI